MMAGKFSLTQIITTTGAAFALIAAIFAIDARYTKDSDLQHVKDEIVDELRTEVTKNRSILIDTMQREADDIEFKMLELEAAGSAVPRYLVEKHKQLSRAIEKLQDGQDPD